MLDQLVQQAEQKTFFSEQDFYCFLLSLLFLEPSLISLLHTKEESKKITDELQQTQQNHQGKQNSFTLSDRFHTIVSKQKKLLDISDVNEFVLLLSFLKILEEFGNKTNYKDVLKEIMKENLHNIRIPPLTKPIFGRKKEISDIFRILDKSYKSNVLIVGPSGVGKTLLVRTILDKLRSDVAFQLFAGNTPLPDQVITLLTLVNGNKLLVFLDDIFTFPQEQITQVLENKQIAVIATANDISFAKYEKTVPEIVAKFEVMHLEEPSETEVKQILSHRLQELLHTHSVTWEEDLIEEIYSLAKQYLPQLSFPAKGLGLLEETVSLAKSQGMSHVKKDFAQTIVSQKTHIPVEDLTEFERKNLSSLGEKLKARVKGQEQAIEQVVKVIQRSKLGFGKKNRPIGSFLFVGPSGVGKTELAKAVAQTVFGNEESMVRLDMSEFTEAHTLQRLIGAPPGYIGFEEGGQLTNPIKAKPYNLVLMDEIEKAHSRVFDIFLQVLDDGRLTDGQGKMVDFRHTIIIATSNAGLDDILDLIAEGKNAKEIEKEVKEILQDYFRIEFINRFDGIIFFNSLQPVALEEIAQLQIEKLKIELSKREIDFAVSDNVIKQIAQMSYDPRYGARELLRIIQDTIENKLAEMIITGQLEKNQKIVF